MLNTILRGDERLDQLVDGDVKIIQSPSVFSFGIDAVLLSRFPRIPKRGLILDLCAGNGAVGLFASQSTQAKIVEVEIQDRLASMAQRSIEVNALSDQVSVVNDNLNNTLNYVNPSSVDLIYCNPPYFKVDPDSILNDSDHYSLARHELTTNLDDIFKIAQQSLKSNGRIAMVHRPDRFLEIVAKMQAHKLVPKRIQFVYPKAGKDANILLIEAIKDGKPGGEKILPPLMVYGPDGDYTDDVKEIYYGDR
jgi:tRNA1(Val) A37 N6-methylase TrmN6